MINKLSFRRRGVAQATPLLFFISPSADSGPTSMKTRMTIRGVRCIWMADWVFQTARPALPDLASMGASCSPWQKTLLLPLCAGQLTPGETLIRTVPSEPCRSGGAVFCGGNAVPSRPALSPSPRSDTPRKWVRRKNFAFFPENHRQTPLSHTLDGFTFPRKL